MANYSDLPTLSEVEKGSIPSGLQNVANAVVNQIVPLVNAVVEHLKRVKGALGACEATLEEHEDRLQALEAQLEQAQYDPFSELPSDVEDNLKDAGYDTPDEVREASDDDLLDVNQVGEATLSNVIRPAFSKQQS